MDERSAIELMRLLHDELDDDSARRLRQRMTEDRGLQEAFDLLTEQWQYLELPEPEVAPPGFPARVLARAQERTGTRWVPSWWSKTLMGRVASVAVLAGGIAIGAILVSVGNVDDWNSEATTEPSLAESYLVAMQSNEAMQRLEDAR
jgi:anti-sigma factor RsiW